MKRIFVEANGICSALQLVCCRYRYCNGCPLAGNDNCPINFDGAEFLKQVEKSIKILEELGIVVVKDE